MLQVIDLISLKPFDIETISNSVKKTKRVIIVEECMKTGGIGASLSAMINESLFDYLDHQASPPTPFLYLFTLELVSPPSPCSPYGVQVASNAAPEFS